MRKIFCLLILAVGVSIFVSCAKNSKKTGREDTLDRIRRTGQIDACTVIYPPYEIKNDKTGAYSGVFIDELNLIAQKMSAKVVWHEVGSGTAVAALVSGQCDVIPGLFALISRAESVAFVQPPSGYIGEGAIVRKDSRFKEVKDSFAFDKPDVTVAALIGESGDIFVHEHFKNSKINEIEADPSEQARFCVEVSAKRADVAIADSNTLALYAAVHPEVIDLFHDQPFGLNPVSWGVRQDDVKWLHFLETALQFLETQGTTAQLEKKYDAHMLHLVEKYKLAK